MDERMKGLGLFALVGAAAGTGLALGMGLRVVAWGAAFGLGAGVVLGLATNEVRHQKRLGYPAPNLIG